MDERKGTDRRGEGRGQVGLKQMRTELWREVALESDRRVGGW